MAEKPILSASDFLAAIQRRPEVFEIEGVGAVKIQPLTVSEAVSITDKYSTNVKEGIFEMIGLGLVEPKLTEEQIAQLQNAAPGPVMALFERIAALSATATSGEAAERAENLAGGGS